ncbi:MAG: 2-succinylbenzoate--CoA ligase [Coleofasciculaceae cyanobacterium]
MEKPLAYLKQHANEDWFIGYESSAFHDLTDHLFQELINLSSGKIPPKIFIAEHKPLNFIAAFLAAVAANCPIFLCNPNWRQQEWQQIFDFVQPDLILGQIEHSPLPHSPTPPFPFSPSGLIMIPTGGSSGKIRFTIHTWETLMASVRGFHRYFGGKPVHSFCVLPLYHVSGLMQFMRSFTTGGRLIVKSSKQLELSETLEINPADFFISLVPTQLQRCLQNPKLTSWLSRFRTVLLGGAPAWESLLEQARLNNIPLAPTYGMTETASQVVTLKPEDFLAGNNSCGQVLPHAKVTICSSTGEILSTNQIGMITIQADSLALGYYPERRGADEENSQFPIPNSQFPIPHSPFPNFKSDDLGFLDDRGYLHIVGRSSQKIITGGENVFPAEVEAAIQATQLVSDVCVMGIPDLQWGQAVTAVYVPHSETASTTLLQAALKDNLSKYKQPKYWVPVEHLPRNIQGKVDYEQLQTMIMTWLESQNSSLQQLG